MRCAASFWRLIRRPELTSNLRATISLQPGGRREGQRDADETGRGSECHNGVETTWLRLGMVVLRQFLRTFTKCHERC